MRHASTSQAGAVTQSKSGLNTYKECKVLPYSNQQLYQVVADIDSYATFIPFLASSTVLDRPQGKPWLEGGSEGDAHKLKAQLKIGFMGFDEAYVSDVEMRKWSMVKVSTVALVLRAPAEALSQANADVPSLFKHLSTQWDLRKIEPAKTEVALQLRFQFSNPFYAAASGAVFEKVARKVMEGFEKRCKSLYG
jgi:coenzyme Q-binding protein COQ10